VDFIAEGVAEAWELIAAGDRDVLHALYVSLLCTVGALALAFVTAVPYGAWLGMHRPRGTRVQVLVLRVGMAFPTVVIGLLVYALLSRRGPLGELDLIYTKSAIVIGEFCLAFPLLGASAYAAAADLDPVVHETARTLGAGRLRAMVTVLLETRLVVATAVLVAFGRCLTELGIATTVGGNFVGRTRTLPGATQLELQMGNFSRAIACGVLLLLLAVAAALLTPTRTRARSGA
jgi:tungstate transport system permease protein